MLRRHMGIDAQGGVRQPIFAVSSGTVIGGTWGTTKRDGHGYGNQVLLSHADGFTTRYAHLADPPLVRPGDTVTMGQLIGYMGGSQRGNLTAFDRHLHFEVTKDGRIIDPLPFLTGASTNTGAPGPMAVAPNDAEITTGTLLYEITPADDGSYVSTSTGLTMNTDVFAAVALGGVT
ncbi:MAG: M23 family metallopeptidase, partial [Microbacterium sp.]